MHFERGFRLISWNNIFKPRGWYWSTTHPWDMLSEMYHSLSKWMCPKAKIKALTWEIYLSEYLVIPKTYKERERNPSSLNVFKQNSSSSQAGRPSTCLEGGPPVRHGSASPSNTLQVWPNTELHHAIFHTVFAEHHAHLHPQNNREINRDDCDSYSLVSAAVERSNNLRLWILGRDFKLAL